MRETPLQVAQIYIDEFSKIKPALIRSTGCLPSVPTFQKYATVLTEDGNYNKAIEVCKLALKYGLHDGSKGGFEARITNIQKKREKESKKILTIACRPTWQPAPLLMSLYGPPSG